MSSAILPRFRGFQWPNTETMLTATRVVKHASGREVRFPLYKFPLYSIELENTWLSSSKKPSDWNIGGETLQLLQSFFANRAGQFDTFTLKKSDYTNDPCDSRAEGALIGIGDGAAATFIFQRWINGNPPFSEPAGQVEPLGLNVYVGGVLQTPGTAYSLGYPNTLTFTGGHIPAASAKITGDYTFYFRVRFADDTLEAVNSAKFLWQVKKLSFQTVKFP